MPDVIGLAGPIGAGKTSFASIAQEEVGITARSFATPVKAACIAAFGWPMSTFNSRESKEHVDPDLGISPRYAAQIFGTEAARQFFGQDVWINVMEKRVRDSRIPVIIDDVRFDNEAEWCRQNGILIHVEAPWTEWSGKHESEVGVTLSQMDYFFYNRDWTPREQKQHVVEFLNMLGYK